MLGCPPLSPKQTRLTLKNLKGRYRWRDRAIVVLGIRSGMRISEILSLKVENVWTGTSTRERIYLGRKNSKGKDRGDSIVLHPKAAAAIAKWIQSRGTVSGGDWLFPSQRCPGRALGRKSAWAILHDALLQAGVEGMAGSHCLRKTFCQNVYRALGGDLFRLSHAMRHSSLLTTLCYLSFRQPEIDSAILRA
jgi:site-specific recombinase XerD